MAIISISSMSQLVVNSRFRPMTYGEMIAPLQSAQRAYEEAEERLHSYLDKSIDEMGKKPRNSSLGLYYINKCIEINTRFKENIFNHGDLLYIKGVWHYLREENDIAKEVLKHAWKNYGNKESREMLTKISESETER